MPINQNVLTFFQTSVARAGSTVNFQVIGPLFKKLTETFDNETALGWTLAIAATTCAVSLLSAIVSYLSIFFIIQ